MDRPYGIKEGSMPDPDNNSINRQPIIVNLRKRERTYGKPIWRREQSWNGYCIIVQRGTIIKTTY